MKFAPSCPSRLSPVRWLLQRRAGLGPLLGGSGRDQGLHALRQGRTALAVGPLGDQVRHFQKGQDAADVPPAQGPWRALAITVTVTLFGAQVLGAIVNEPMRALPLYALSQTYADFIRLELVLGWRQAQNNEHGVGRIDQLPSSM